MDRVPGLTQPARTAPRSLEGTLPDDVVARIPFLQDLPYPALWIDPSRHIGWMNDAARATYGPAIGACYRTIHGFDAPCYRRGERCPLEEQGSQPTTMRHIHRTGRGPEFFLVTALPTESAGALVLHLPLGDDLLRDSLTGLYSRTAFEQLVAMQLRLLRRWNETYSVVLVDVDHLKLVNDLHGHAIGDRVLRSVAGCLARSVRAADCVGRWGGDELCVLLPSAARRHALRTVARFTQALDALRIAEAPDLAVTVSFGIASCRRNYDLKAALRRADRALYRAKAAHHSPAT